MVLGSGAARFDDDQQSHCRTREETVNIFRGAGYRLLLQSKTEIKYDADCVGSHMYCFQPYDIEADNEQSDKYRSYRHEWSAYTDKVSTRNQRQGEIKDMTLADSLRFQK